LSDKKNASVKKIKKLLKKQEDQLKINLVACCSMFGFLPAAITQLESSQLELSEQICVLDDVKRKLKSNRGPRAKRVLEKFSKLMFKNNGIGCILKCLN